MRAGEEHIQLIHAELHSWQFKAGSESGKGSATSQGEALDRVELLLLGKVLGNETIVGMVVIAQLL